MDRSALLLYLRDLRDLEFAKKKIEVLFNNKKRKYEQIVNNLSTTNYVKIPDEKSGWSIGRVVGIILFGIVGIILVYAMMFGTVVEKEFFEDSRAYSGYGVKYVNVPIMQKKGIAFILILFLVICIIGLIVIICCIVDEAKENRENIEIAKQHNEKVSLQEKTNKELIAQKRQQWQQEADYLTKEYEKVKELLNESYGLNILATQYRNLASVYYIYDYMSTSQETLKDTLIHEHMKNGIQRILAKLDYIICQNQEMIFHNRRVESDNRKIIQQNEEMLKTLNRVEEDTNLAIQYMEISANYSKAIAYFSAANYLSK